LAATGRDWSKSRAGGWEGSEVQLDRTGPGGPWWPSPARGWGLILGLLRAEQGKQASLNLQGEKRAGGGGGGIFLGGTWFLWLRGN
jgi:hypothetical protein